MDQSGWSAVEAYFNGHLIARDPALERALERSAAAGLPPIAVAENQGKLLMLLAETVGARRILEIGALGGYSAIWLARALSAGGRLISLELDPKHAETARANLAAAGLAGVTEVRVGPAIDSLPKLAKEGAGPFDFVFIDADKPSNADYFAWALKLARPGGLIVVDNVVRGGGVVDAGSLDPSVQGVRAWWTLWRRRRRSTPPRFRRSARRVGTACSSPACSRAARILSDPARAAAGFGHQFLGLRLR